MELKVSAKMHQELLVSANWYQNSHGVVAHCNRRTEDALLRRGLITYDTHREDNFPVITVKGWAYLASKGFNRRAEDPGRLSLEEAREEAYAERPCDVPAPAVIRPARKGLEPSVGTVHVNKHVRVTTEMTRALAMLRGRAVFYPGDDIQNAIDILDNAGIFSAIDEATGYDVDPEPEPVSKCDCPGVVRRTGQHLNGCPGDPAEWGDMAYTTKPTAADNIRAAINLKF